MIERSPYDFFNLWSSVFITVSTIIIIVLTFFTSAINSNNLYALIVGYIGLFFGVFIVVLKMFMEPKQIPDGLKFTNLAPYLILCGLILISVIMVFVNFDKIANGEIAPMFYTFSKLCALLICAQLAWFKMYNNSQMSNVTIGCILLALSIITLYYIISQGIILKYFSTQG